MDIDGYHADIIPNTSVRESVGTRINFTCSTTPPDAYPSWKIGDIVYDTAHLPSGFVATQFNFSFPIQTTGMISCFFQIWHNGIIVDICSNRVNLIPQESPDTSRGWLQVALYEHLFYLLTHHFQMIQPCILIAIMKMV